LTMATARYDTAPGSALVTVLSHMLSLNLSGWENELVVTAFDRNRSLFLEGQRTSSKVV